MIKESLTSLVDKVIGKTGQLHSPAWWMHRIFSKVDEELTEVDNVANAAKATADKAQDAADAAKALLDAITASGDNSGASGQYILHSGMLNLRDTHDTVCRAKHVRLGDKFYIVKLVLNNEVNEYDLSEWFNEGDVVNVYPMNWDFDEYTYARATLDGLTVRITRAGGYSSRVAVAIVLRDDYFGDTDVQYIRMSKGKITPVSAATQDALPRIGFADAVNIVRNDNQRDKLLNGYHFQIQRRRANSHWWDDEEEHNNYERHRKWREWKKFVKRPYQGKKTLVYRVRYKSGTGRVGPWTYISKRKGNYDEI